MNFRVGQKVVCVNANPIEPGTGRYGDLDGLAMNAVYTIRALSNCLSGSLGIHLHEIDRGIYGPPYAAIRFRPVVERKTDISIFTEMLKPKQRELISP